MKGQYLLQISVKESWEHCRGKFFSVAFEIFFFLMINCWAYECHERPEKQRLNSYCTLSFQEWDKCCTKPSKAACALSSAWTGWLPAQSLHSPLGAVWMARVALPILIGVLENEAIGALQAIRTFLHTVWTILEMETLCAVVRSLESVEERNAVHSSYSVLCCCTGLHWHTLSNSCSSFSSQGAVKYLHGSSLSEEQHMYKSWAFWPLNSSVESKTKYQLLDELLNIIGVA